MYLTICLGPINELVVYRNAFTYHISKIGNLFHAIDNKLGDHNKPQHFLPGNNLNFSTNIS